MKKSPHNNSHTTSTSLSRHPELVEGGEGLGVRFMKKSTLLTALLLFTLICSEAYAQEQGQNLIDSLKTELKTVKTDTTKVNILNGLSEHAGWRINDNDASIDYAQQALDLATKAKFKNGMAKAHNNMGNAFAQKYNTKEAFKNYFTALELYKETGNKFWEGRIHNNIAITYKDLADYPKSIEYYTLAKKLATEVGDQTLIAETSIGVANIYIMLSNYPEALESYFAALKIYESIGDKNGIANCHLNIGKIYLSQSNYPEALKNVTAALKICEAIGEKNGIAACYNGMGFIYSDQGNYPEALQHYSAALKISEAIGDKIVIAYCYNNIGEVYYKQKTIPSAIENYLLSLKIKKEIGDKYGIAYTYNNLGVAYTQLKNYSQAETYFQKALLLSKEMGNKENLKNSYSGMAILDSTTSNWQGAYENYKHFTVYKDSIYNEENTKKLTQTQMQYEFDKKEAIAKSEQEKKEALSREQLAKARNNRNLALAGVGIFMIVAVFSGIGFFQKRKSNKIISKEKQKSDNLLLNILPEEVAEELKETGSSEAKHFDSVSIMFTDFKEFTKLSEKISSRELIDELNHCFKAFDEIIVKHGIEKIKTIGDAYMAVCGLPVPHGNHAQKMIEAALEIRDFIEDYKHKRQKEGKPFFEMRIGINSGEVVAGIVGIKKFAYDIWGDAVNTASRMESNGAVGKINISESTYELAKNDFDFEHRGEIETKGKGKINMYFVESKAVADNLS